MRSLAKITRALADETRLRILMALLEGEATVSDLVTRLGLAQPRISTHLAVLRQAGLVTTQHVGRQRLYRLAGAPVRDILSALRALASVPPRRRPQAERAVRRHTALRQARTCYDHLAGMAGVDLLDALLQHGWVEPEACEKNTRPQYRLTAQGAQALAARGVDLASAYRTRRQFAYGCPDWTERRPHLGGALGAAIFHALQRTGVLRQQRQSRVVQLQRPVREWLNPLPSR
ncbi:MAG: transcriptional regulator [Candidatus Tectimicrobiota bacterium]|nr:MAG: transcriptional regulator [Candidatus Tectomicrobia bacterium]